MAGIGFGTNYDVKAGNGLGGQTRIISLSKTNMTQAELDTAIQFMTAGGVKAVDDAHTVVGVSVLTEGGVFTSGTTDAVQVAIQGTGAFTADANYGVAADTGITSALVANFID
jgi:hypothetical protein